MELDITNDEVIVLLAFLGRYSDTDHLVIEDQAEQHALWGLQCTLEKVNAEIFSPDWNKYVRQAKDNLCDERTVNSNCKMQQGRFALWLSAEEIIFLLDESRKLPADTSQSVKQCWSNIAKRANITLDSLNINKSPLDLE